MKLLITLLLFGLSGTIAAQEKKKESKSGFGAILTSQTETVGKPDDLESWLYSVEKDFFGTNISSPDVVKIRHNLFSDKYFIPVFGKPFPNLTESERNRYLKKIEKLKRKHEWGERLYSYTIGTYNVNQTFKAIATLNQLRKDYAIDVQNIKSGQTGLHYLSSLKRSKASKYNRLLPSEVSELLNLVESSEEKIASDQLKAKALETNGYENILSNISTLEGFEETNKTLYEKASSQVVSEANEIVQKKIHSILDQVLSRYSTQRLPKLTKWIATKTVRSFLTQWENIELLDQEFREKLEPYSDYQIVKNEFEEFDNFIDVILTRLIKIDEVFIEAALDKTNEEIEKFKIFLIGKTYTEHIYENYLERELIQERIHMLEKLMELPEKNILSSNDSQSKYLLARYYVSGYNSLIVPVTDYKKYYPQALIYLPRNIKSNTELTKDKGAKIAMDLSESGYAEAQTLLGLMYLEGDFGKGNAEIKKGVYWIKEAKESGEARAIELWEKLRLSQYQ